MLYQKSRAKNIISDKQQLKSVVLDSIGRMSAVVGRTLGPGGNPVIIERDGLSPLITKDGVTVARSLGMDRSEANIIIEAAKEICVNTAKQAGDGTTTAIVLANWLVKYGQEFMEKNPKYNPQRLVFDLQEAYETVIVPYLKEYAIKVASPEQLKNVATISANGDLKVAEAVVQAVMNAGDDGTVLIEEGQGNMMKVETA